MAHEVTIPSPGESVTEVTIDEWLKKDGDYVQQDEAIAEILSDKASLTLYAEQAGKLSIQVQAGETVEVGTTAALIDTEAEAPAGGGASGGGEAASEPAASGPASQPAQPAQPAQSSAETAVSTHASGTPSPSADKMMKEQGISSDAINGSGRGGRITKSDVVEHMNQPQQPAQPAEQPQPEAKQAPQQQPQQAQQQQQQPAPQQAPQGTRNEWREKMTPLRRTLANRLVSVKNETAMLTTFNEVDMSGIMELRNRYKDTFKDKHGFKLGFMGFFTMASCRALLEFPQVNAYIDEDTYELVYHDYCDVGVAVSTERGLVVPVIRSAESLTLTQIEYEINNLAQKARDNKITIPEMTGGTFTISNGGVFGSLLSTPILNPPQSAILGMHRTDERPVAINGEVKIRPMMYVALSYDHRVVDGKESVSFLYRIKEYLEDPARMLLDI